ncbi:helix-turn-helix domain-containing protein [Geovibrio thiophilus]|uniref:Helix-turn-helix domain-containing protein n=1 Tax=Geovibrio thiophilus TaxID=139438 RepID=A0A410JY55_9BACT|nr:RodZ domain-containing protein [Geovibrio thiophilus]QAR33136.1 helix-turn-helix domain-containing protein [Geovibrio thiophilus]
MSKLGELLKNERINKNINFDTITEKTRISEEILLRLEAGDFNRLPSYIHARNFVKTYANFLKLAPEEVEVLFDEECTRESFDREIHYVSSPVTHEPIDRKSPVGFVTALIIVIVLVIAAAYFFMSMKNNDAMNKKETKINITETEPVQNDAGPQDVIPQAEPMDNSSAVSPDVVESPDAPSETKPADSTPASVQSAAAQPQPLPASVPSPAPGMRAVVLTFSDVCWVNIEVDNGTVYDFIAEKGIERTVEFKDYFILNLGNAAVAEVHDKNNRYRGFGEYRKPVKNLKFSYDAAGKLIYQKQN